MTIICFQFSYRNTTDYVGATYQGKMCDKNYAGGVALVCCALIYLIKMYNGWGELLAEECLLLCRGPSSAPSTHSNP